MEFKILTPKDYSSNLKATIQKSGKLNFTEQTSKVLQFSEETCIKLATDNNGDLYMILLESPAEDTFQIRKSGRYFYVPAQNVFDALGIDYKKRTVIFDLQRKVQFDEELSGKVYKMSKRELARKLGKEVDMAE